MKQLFLSALSILPMLSYSAGMNSLSDTLPEQTRTIIVTVTTGKKPIKGYLVHLNDSGLCLTTNPSFYGNDATGTTPPLILYSDIKHISVRRKGSGVSGFLVGALVGAALGAGAATTLATNYSPNSSPFYLHPPVNKIIGPFTITGAIFGALFGTITSMIPKQFTIGREKEKFNQMQKKVSKKYCL